MHQKLVTMVPDLAATFGKNESKLKHIFYFLLEYFFIFPLFQENNKQQNKISQIVTLNIDIGPKCHNRQRSDTSSDRTNVTSKVMRQT